MGRAGRLEAPCPHGYCNHGMPWTYSKQIETMYEISVWTDSATFAGQRLCIIALQTCSLSLTFPFIPDLMISGLRSWMFVVLVMGFFHWILLCLPGQHVPHVPLGGGGGLDDLDFDDDLINPSPDPGLDDGDDGHSNTLSSDGHRFGPLYECYMIRAFTTQVRYRHDPPRMLE